MKDEYFSSSKDADKLMVIILQSQMVRSSYRRREELLKTETQIDTWPLLTKVSELVSSDASPDQKEKKNSSGLGARMYR